MIWGNEEQKKLLVAVKGFDIKHYPGQKSEFYNLSLRMPHAQLVQTSLVPIADLALLSISVYKS